MSSAQARGKSILLHVLRNADQIEEESLRVEQARLLEREPTFQFYKKSKTEEDPLKTNAWLLIRDTAMELEPQISNILDGIIQDKPIHTRSETGIALVGSNLYDIGGRGTTLATRYHLSNQIRRLDWEHIDDGWKSEELPIYCASPITVVYGDLIYMFPSGLPFTKMCKDADVESPPSPWAYVYDTVKNVGYDLDLPPDCNNSRPPFCASVEGVGVVVPIEEPRSERMALYLHKPVERVWERIDDGEETLFSQFYSMPYTISKGILYAYYIPKNEIGFLYCYKICPWSFIGRIELPEFESLDTKWLFYMNLVPLADNELCILRHRWTRIDGKESQLHYARISVSFQPLAVVVLKQAVFSIDALAVNCLPFGYQIEEDLLHSGETQLRERSHVSTNEQKKQEPEVDWKGRCMKLQEELRKKEKENQSLRSLLRKLNIDPIPDPAQLPRKKVKTTRAGHE